MSRLITIFFLLLLSSSVFASNWYVCPESAGVKGLANGSSLTNCFNGANDYRLSADAINPGDIVYICGDFKKADTRFLIANSGNPGAWLTISGNAAACNRASNSSISRGGANGIGGRAVAATGQKYVKITELTIKDCDQSCISWDYKTSINDNTSLWVDRVSFLNCGAGTAPGDCIWKRGAELRVTDSIFDGCYEDCIWFRGKNISVGNSTFKRISNGGANGDATQVDLTGIANTGAVRWFNNYCDHRLRDYKYCLVVGPTAGAGSLVSVYNNKMLCAPGGSGGNLSCHPLYIDATPSTSIDIHSNWIEGGYNGISVTSASPGTFSTRAKVYSNIIRSAANRGIWLDGNVNGVDILNNTIDRSNTGLHVGRASATVSVINNIFVANNVGIFAVSTPSEFQNNGFSNNLVNVSESGVNRILRSGNIEGAPSFTGGTAPNAPTGYKLGVTSAFRDSGTVVDVVDDFFGCRYSAAHPSLGAIDDCPSASEFDARSVSN